MPDSFITFYNEMLLQLCERPGGTPRLPRKGRKAESEKNKAAPVSNLQNARTALYNYLGRNTETERDWIKVRWEDKKDFYRKHYVSSLMFTAS